MDALHGLYLTKRLEKKLDGNYTRMLRAILNKSWRQHPTRHQLYGHLPPITKTNQVRRTRHAGHCWRSRDELISDVLLWTPNMAGQKQDDQHEHTFSNYVRIRYVVQKTCLRGWKIGKSGDSGSGISVLPARHDDDDDDDTTLRNVISLLMLISCVNLRTFKTLFFKNANTLYTSKQPLMMAYDGSKSAWNNFRKSVYQFQPEIKTLMRKLERILNKLYRKTIVFSISACVRACVRAWHRVWVLFRLFISDVLIVYFEKLY